MERQIKTIRDTSEDVVIQMLEFCPIQAGSRILEPSAGKGFLLYHMANLLPIYHTFEIDCVELNKENLEILKENGYNVIGEDFLEMKYYNHKKYDYIIAAPTYKNNIDVEHIMHMYKYLRRGGRIVSLTHPTWTTNNSERQQRFRKWLEDKDYSMVMLKDNSYIEKYKTQPSMIIKINYSYE